MKLSDMKPGKIYLIQHEEMARVLIVQRESKHTTFVKTIHQVKTDSPNANRGHWDIEAEYWNLLKEVSKETHPEYWL